MVELFGVNVVCPFSNDFVRERQREREILNYVFKILLAWYQRILMFFLCIAYVKLERDI